MSKNGLEIRAHMSEGIKSWRNDVFRPSVRGLVNAAQLFGFTWHKDSLSTRKFRGLNKNPRVAKRRTEKIWETQNNKNIN